MNRKEATSLLVSGLAITSGVVSAYLTGGITLIDPEILAEGLKSLGGLGGNLVANAIQAKLIDNHPQEDVLKNGDLTRAIGSAIFKLCGELARETNDKSDKNALEELSQISLEVWENLIIGGEYEEGYGLSLAAIDLDEVSAEKSVQYVCAQADKLGEIKTLTPQIWQNIIITLYKKERFSLSQTARAELAGKLHKEFARALQSVLIADFAGDGKAYANMQFRILSEILAFTKETQTTGSEIFDKIESILDAINLIFERFGKEDEKSLILFWEIHTTFFFDVINKLDLQIEVAHSQLKESKEQTKDGKETNEILRKISESSILNIPANQIQIGSFVPQEINIEEELLKKVEMFFEEIKASIKLFLFQPEHYEEKKFPLAGFQYQIYMEKKSLK